MPMFRKKPVEIEARQVPDPRSDLPSNVEFSTTARWCDGDQVNDAVDGWCIIIDTLEGQMKAKPGDWIIKGVKGEFYPCSADIFAQIYEAVEGAT